MWILLLIIGIGLTCCIFMDNDTGEVFSGFGFFISVHSSSKEKWNIHPYNYRFGILFRINCIISEIRLL